VRRVWEHYTYGIEGGKPVRELDMMYKGAWRKGANQKMLHSRMMVIVGRIQQRAATIGEEEAVKELEKFRMEKGWGLNMLVDKLKEGAI